MEKFTIGGVEIPSAFALLTLGLIVGLGMTWIEGKRRLRNSEMALDLGIWVVCGGFVGSLIGSLLIYWLGQSQLWGQMATRWNVQLSFPGAFLGGLLVVGIFVWYHRRDEERVSFWELADLLTPGLTLGVAAVWAASLALGQKSLTSSQFSLDIGYVLLPDLDGVEQFLSARFDHYGLEMASFTLQGLGIGLALILGAVFCLLRKRWPFDGAACLMFVLLYFSGQFWIQVAEAHYGIFAALVYLGPWRIEQVIALVLASFAAVGLLALWWRAKGKAATTRRLSPLVIPLVVGLVVIGLVAGSICTSDIERPELIGGTHPAHRV